MHPFAFVFEFNCCRAHTVFWTEHVLKLFGPEAVNRAYPTLNNEATVYYNLVKLCLRLLEANRDARHPQLSSLRYSFRMSCQTIRARHSSPTVSPLRGHKSMFTMHDAIMVCAQDVQPIKLAVADRLIAVSQVKQSSEVLDTFENDSKTWIFFASVFSYISQRAGENLPAFEGFELHHLSEMAKSGREALDKV